MPELNPKPPMYQDVYDDEIDIASLISVIWKHRKLIIWGTLVMTVISAAVSMTLPKTYVSSGYYQLGTARVATINPGTINPGTTGVPIITFKNSSTQFYSLNRLQLYHEQGAKLSDDLWRIVNEGFKNPDSIKKCITPVYAYSKDDEKEMGAMPSDEKNSVIGVDLSYEAASPRTAHDFVAFLSGYVKDCMLYASLYDFIQNGFNSSQTDLGKIENDIINNQFQLLQNTNKANDIQAILKKYPGFGKIEDRQVVSVQEGGFHYLSPTTQIVGIESTIADIRCMLAASERDKEKLLISNEFFSKSKDAMEKSNKIGRLLLSQVQSIKNDMFKDKDLNKDTVKEVFNTINIDLLTMTNKYENYHFVSGPSLPDRPIKPNKRTIVAVTFFMSLFVWTFLAFIVEWWMENKDTVKNSNSPLALKTEDSLKI
jgi:hypothetical protein